MFAIITPALITEAFAERMRFSSFPVLSVLWAVLICNPVCHWIWGVGGWLGSKGVPAGNLGFPGIQVFGVFVVGLCAFAISWVLLKAVDATVSLRLYVDSEVGGLNLSEYSKTGYS